MSKHNLALGPTALIVLSGGLLSALGYRVIGHLGDRFDKRHVLAFIYLAVLIIFLCFCFDIPTEIVVVLFLADSFLFGASVITDSSLASNAPSGSGEFAGNVSNVSMGVTMFCLAGILVPYLGGIAWERGEPQAPFVVGGIFAGLAILVSRKIGTTTN